MRNQVSLYSWTQRRLTLAEQPLSLELSTFNYRLLGNDVTTSDAICCEPCLDFVNGLLAAAYHSDGFELFAGGEHVFHVGDFTHIPAT